MNNFKIAEQSELSFFDYAIAVVEELEFFINKDNWLDILKDKYSTYLTQSWLNNRSIEIVSKEILSNYFGN